MLFHQRPNVKNPRPLPASRLKVQAIIDTQIYLHLYWLILAEWDLLPLQRNTMWQLLRVHHCCHFISNIIFGILVKGQSLVYDSLISSSHPSCRRQPVSLPGWGRCLQSLATSLYCAAESHGALTAGPICQIIRFIHFYQTCLWIITILQCGTMLYGFWIQATLCLALRLFMFLSRTQVCTGPLKAQQ